MSRRTAAVLTGLSLTLGGVVASPSGTPAAAAQPTTQPLTDSVGERAAAAKPKVGTYQGTWGEGYFIAFDVARRKGGFVVKNAVSMYGCGSEPVYSTFGTVPVRNGRFSRSGVVSINGTFTSKKKAKGRANPAPGLQGCNGKPKPYRVAYAGKAQSRTGDYLGTDTTGAAVTLSVEGAGKIVGGIDVARRLQCGSVQLGSLFRFGRAGIPVGGAAQSSFTDDNGTVHSYTATFPDSRTVTGTYRVSGTGCDTGQVAFSATHG